VAEKLSPDPVVKVVRREKILRRMFFPFRQDPREPEPEIIVSCGRVSEYFVNRMKQAYGRRPFCVHLQFPAQENDCYDLVFVAHHHWRAEFDSEPRFRKMLGVPNRINARKLAAERPAARAKWAPNDEKVAALLIGGPSKAFSIDEKTVEHLASTVRTLLSQGWTVLATVSRRSPPYVAAQLSKISDKDFRLWNFRGENPYVEYLAAADAFIVTEDSVTMVAEATASGKPIHIFPLVEKNLAEAAKFRRFHADLIDKGVARSFHGIVEEFSYVMADETERIAAIVAELAPARGTHEPGSAGPTLAP
jgi:mitochondrial fission protein ELM1